MPSEDYPWRRSYGRPDSKAPIDQRGLREGERRDGLTVERRSGSLANTTAQKRRESYEDRSVRISIMAGESSSRPDTLKQTGSAAYLDKTPCERGGPYVGIRCRVSGAGLFDGGQCAGAGARKPPKEETAGRLGAVWRARLWGFEDRGRLASELQAAGGAQHFRRKR